MAQTTATRRYFAAKSAKAKARSAAVATALVPMPSSGKPRAAFRDRVRARIAVRLVGTSVEVRYQGRPGDKVADVRTAFDALYWKGAGDVVLPNMCVRIGMIGRDQPAEGEWMANAPIGEFRRLARKPRDAAHAAEMAEERRRDAIQFAISYDPGRCSHELAGHLRGHHHPHEAHLRNGNW
jgi:hypothetical protein